MPPQIHAMEYWAVALTFLMGLYYSITGLYGIIRRRITYLNLARGPWFKPIVHAEGMPHF